MKRVLIESPYAGDVEANLEYLGRCVRHSLARDEAPFASHGLYTRWLDDENPAERALGTAAGSVWGRAADVVAFYVDRGLSQGMVTGLSAALARLRQRHWFMVEARSLTWSEPARMPDHLYGDDDTNIAAAISWLHEQAQRVRPATASSKPSPDLDRLRAIAEHWLKDRRTTTYDDAEYLVSAVPALCDAADELDELRRIRASNAQQMPSK